jgi:amino acid transporter
MFTQGQIIFALIFIFFFVSAMIYTYKKDKNTHKNYYKGSYKVIIGFVVFILLLFVIKIYLKNK